MLVRLFDGDVEGTTSTFWSNAIVFLQLRKNVTIKPEYNIAASGSIIIYLFIIKNLVVIRQSKAYIPDNQKKMFFGVYGVWIPGTENDDLY